MALTSLQQVAFDNLMAGKNVFLTGKAGTGKSYVIERFIEELAKENRNYLVVAPTGIAAMNVGGVTIHRSFGASLQPQISKNIQSVPDVVLQADIIIVDEISMCRVDLFDYMVRVIAKAETTSMKRKQLVVVGDFFQLPPVTTDADYKVLKEFYPEYDKGFAFESENWQDLDFKMIELTEVQRQKDMPFIDALNKIRIGDESAVAFFNEQASPTKKEKGIVLCATNKEAKKMNQAQLDQLKGKSRIYHSIIEGEVKASDKPTLDELEFKVGARVVLLVNDTQEDLYQNGSFATITGLKDDAVSIKLDQNNETIKIGYYNWDVEDYVIEEKVVNGVKSRQIKKTKIGSFKQLPLKLAYAITIHKSQGQTYDEVNLIPYSFDCGQLYVAISRVKSLDGLYLVRRMRKEDLIFNEKVKAFYKVKNQATTNELLLDFAKKVFAMKKDIKKQFPIELLQLMQDTYEKIKQES